MLLTEYYFSRLLLVKISILLQCICSSWCKLHTSALKYWLTNHKRSQGGQNEYKCCELVSSSNVGKCFSRRHCQISSRKLLGSRAWCVNKPYEEILTLACTDSQRTATVDRSSWPSRKCSTKSALRMQS